MSSLVDKSFSERLLAWFDLHGRHDLPWQHPPSPYRVWVSEVMLQQTQVVTVIPYFERFMHRFPTVVQLAAASVDEVLAHWSGLGYYARGRNLHKAAQMIVQQHAGMLPDSVDQLIALPGIGRSTAHAILSLAYQQPKAICDGNVKRVLARWSALTVSIDSTEGLALLWQLAELLQSKSRAADYTQAIMDLGATICTRTRPRCEHCPVQMTCLAYRSTESVTVWPIRKPKPSKPVRETTMYLLINQEGLVWLQAPVSDGGLWGGLYQLPQALPVGVVAHEYYELPQIKHVFTHFSLWISGCVVLLDNHSQIALHNNGLWYNPSKDADVIARPAVVDKLIRHWQQQGIAV